MKGKKRYVIRDKDAIVDARKVLGYTHTAFAKACGVSRQYMYRVLDGEEITKFRAEYISYILTNKYEISRKFFKIAYQSQRAWVV